jgi:monofunctional biosynthetic peptidoglycan transglycosylase
MAGRGAGKARWRLFRAAVAAGAAGFAVLAYVYLTLPDVRALASTNPSSTAFMEQRAVEAALEGRTTRRVQEWVPYSGISENLKRAVLVAEDAAFWQHDGIDLQQIRESIQTSWEEGVPIRGASTITQQLAKNLYLSPSRDPLRKLRELIIARRLEAAVSKTRIFEIYLNAIEWGDGIWGAEAAARTYFGISAAALDAEQSALLAGAIINPRLHSPARPTSRLLQRQQIILGRMGPVRSPAPEPTAVAAPARPAIDEALQRTEIVDYPFAVLGEEDALAEEEVSAEEVAPAESVPSPAFPETEPVPTPAPFPTPVPAER